MRYFTPYWKRGLSIEQYMNDTERTFWPDPLGQPDWNVEQYRTLGIEKRISRACRTDNPNRSVSDER